MQPDSAQPEGGINIFLKRLKYYLWFVPAIIVSVSLMDVFVGIGHDYLLMALFWVCGTVCNWAIFALYVGVLPQFVGWATVLLPPFISVPAVLNAIGKHAIENKVIAWRRRRAHSTLNQR